MDSDGTCVNSQVSTASCKLVPLGLLWIDIVGQGSLNTISKLSAKYQFSAIHTADNTDGKVTIVRRLSAVSEKVHRLDLPSKRSHQSALECVTVVDSTSHPKLPQSVSMRRKKVPCAHWKRRCYKFSKVNFFFFIAQYPVRWTAQTLYTFCLPWQTCSFRHRSQLLREAF